MREYSWFRFLRREDLTERGALPEALNELRGFLTAHPFRGESWKLLGKILERMGQPLAARGAYHEAAIRDAHDGQAREAEQRLAATAQ